MDRLADPVAGIGAEPDAEAGVVLGGGADQPEVALANQVVQLEAAADKPAGDGDDQAEVGAGQAVAGRPVAGGDGVAQGDLLVGREQGLVADQAGVTGG